MLSKNDIKYFSSLLKKKYRDKENKFLIEGTKIVQESLWSNYKCELILVTHEYFDKNSFLIKKLNEKGLKIEIITNRDFAKISDTVNPQGISAILDIPDVKPLITEKFLSNSQVVCLENISEPGNLGTIIRNCDWFGIKDLILSENCADIYNPKTIRASMGSIFHLNLFHNIDFINMLNELKHQKYDLLCADIEGNNIYDYKFERKSVIIFCNEANGPSPEMIKLSDKKITIPKFGNAESLNVASASAVILSEIAKQSVEYK